MNSSEKFTADQDKSGEWFVFDNEACYCVAGPMSEHNAIQTAINLRDKELANERKRKERERDKEQGLIRRDVKAHADDWPEIKALELKLKNARNWR
jgi:hypothetical protein